MVPSIGRASLSLTLLLESQDGVLSSSEVEAGVLEYIYIAKERYRGAEAARGELTKADIFHFSVIICTFCSLVWSKIRRGPVNELINTDVKHANGFNVADINIAVGTM